MPRSRIFTYSLNPEKNAYFVNGILQVTFLKSASSSYGGSDSETSSEAESETSSEPQSQTTSQLAVPLQEADHLFRQPSVHGVRIYAGKTILLVRLARVGEWYRRLPKNGALVCYQSVTNWYFEQ